MADPNENGQKAQAQQKENQIKQEIQTKSGDDLVNEFKAQRAAAEATIDAVDAKKEEVIKNHDLPEVVKTNPQKLAQAKNVAEVVQRTIVAIKENKILLSPSTSTQILKETLARITNITDASESTASYLYKIIDLGMKGELEDSGRLISALKLIDNLKYLNVALYSNILDDFYKKAQSIGLSDAQKEIFERMRKEVNGELNEENKNNSETDIDFEAKIQEAMQKGKELNELLKQYADLTQEYMDDPTKSPLWHRIKNKLKENLRAKYTNQGGKVDEQSLDVEAETLAVKEIGEVQGEILSCFDILDQGNLERGIKPHLSEIKLQDHLLKLHNLVRQGYLEPSTVAIIENKLREYANYMENLPQYKHDTRQNELISYADHYGIALDPEDKELIYALSNADEFVKYLQKCYTGEGVNRHLDFEKLWERIRDVCENIISVTDDHPDLFFKEAFNAMYHGHIYDQLIALVKNIGPKLEENEKTKGVASEMVKYHVLTNTRDPNAPQLKWGANIISGKDLTYKTEVEDKLSRVISTEIVDHMATFREVIEYVHDADKIVSEGMGWETMNKYVERPLASKLDWFHSQDKDLTLAIQFYIPSLKEFIYLNNYVIRPGFNAKGVYGLDEAQRMALFKLLGTKKVSAEHGRETKELKKLKRRVLWASGDTKGYTFEYWSIIKDPDMPRGESLVKDADFPGGYRYELDISGEGTDSSVDRMKSAYDPMATWRRFHLIRHLETVPYVYIPRKLDEFDPWSHADFSQKRRKIEDAIIRGATTEYLDDYKKEKTLYETARYMCVGMYARGAWRTDEYLRFVEMQDGGEYYDFPKTMAKLIKVGSYAVKSFIDSFNDGLNRSERNLLKDRFHLVDDQTWEDIMGKNWLEGMKSIKLKEKETWRDYISDEDKNKFIAKLEKEFVWERIISINPTRALEYERRQFTPMGESLVRDDVWSFLEERFKGKLDKNIIREKLTPLFVEAFELVQVQKREQFNTQAQNCKTMTELRKLISTGLTIEDLKNLPDLEGKVKIYFENMKNSWPLFVNEKFKSDIGFLEFTEFYNELLPGFLNVLKKSISKPRVERQSVLEFDDNGLVSKSETIPTFVYSGSPFQPKHPQGTKEFRKELKEYEEKRNEEYKDKKYITLVDRFIIMAGKGIINLEIGGEDMDRTEWYYARSGQRAAARFTGEQFGITQEVTGILNDLFFVQGPNLMKRQYSNDQELEQVVSKNISPAFGKIRKGMEAPDAELGPQAVQELGLLLARCLGRDNHLLNRMAFVGDGIEDWGRRRYGSEGSLYQDCFVSRYDRPTIAFNSNQLQAYFKTIFNDNSIAWEEKNIHRAGYKKTPEIEWKLFGKTLLRMHSPDFMEKYVYEDRKIPFINKTIKWPKLKLPDDQKNKWNYELIKNTEGLTFKNKIWDRWIPIGLFILALIIFNFLMAADKKNKGK